MYKKLNATPNLLIHSPSQMAHTHSVLHPLFLLIFTPPTTLKINPNKKLLHNINLNRHS